MLKTSKNRCTVTINRVLHLHRRCQKVFSCNQIISCHQIAASCSSASYWLRLSLQLIKLNQNIFLVTLNFEIYEFMTQSRAGIKRNKKSCKTKANQFFSRFVKMTSFYLLFIRSSNQFISCTFPFRQDDKCFTC